MAIVLDGTAGITTPDLTDTSLTSGRVVYAGTSGNLTGASAFQFNGTNELVLNNTGGDAQMYFGGSSGTTRMYLARSGSDSLLWNVSAGAMRFGTNDTERLRITSAGDVGIGTSSPPNKLTVDINTASQSTGITLQNSNTGGYGTVFNSALYGYAGSPAGMYNVLSMQTFYDGATGYVLFYTKAQPQSSAVLALSLLGNGNVGIGTGSPGNLLSVLSSSTTATVAKFAATNYGNLGTTYIEIGTQNGDGGSRIGSINPTGNQSILVFETMTATSGTYAERARIENNGNLMVGTTSQIGSPANRVVIKFDNNNFYGLGIGGSASGGAAMINFYNSAGTEQGYISSTGSGSTTYSTSSDYRLKENIAPMTGALAKVAQLKPVTYTWKQDGSSGQGFIAHELQAIVPDCVTREKDGVDAKGNPKYQGVDTSFLVATLTAAIQEQQALITTLTERITALEGA